MLSDDTSTVRSSVEFAILLDDALNPGVHFIAVGDVHFGHRESYVERAEVLLCLLQLVRVHIRHTDSGAFLRQDLSRGQANASGRTTECKNHSLE